MGNISDGDGTPLFAAIKTFYENGNDILSAICSLVLVTVVDGDDLQRVKQHFSETYLLDIPSPVLKTILKRLKRNSKVKYAAQVTNIVKTENGNKESDELLNSVRELGREYRSLITNLHQFFDARGYERLSNPEKDLLTFIDQNIGFASNALALQGKSVSADTSRIAEYILHVEHSDPGAYVLLQNIFFGRLYLSMIKTRNEYSMNVKMEPTTLYLDTSIVMRLLGLDGEQDEADSRELLAVIMTAANVRVKIFSVTLDEARRLLESIQKEAVTYTKNIAVKSIHYNLRLKGYDRHRMTLLIESLEQRILDLGIEIEELRKIEPDAEYKDIESELNTWASLLEAPKTNNTLTHDASILYAISALRGGIGSKLFEKCKAVFVSPDRVVHTVASEMASKHNAFPLALNPLDIASMIWMRDIGNEKIATNVLRQSMMAYVREKAISNKLWETFVTALKDAQSRELISREDVALILSSDDTAILLAEKQFEATDQIIDPKFVESLRRHQKKLSSDAEYGKHLNKSIDQRVHTISHRWAFIVSHSLAALAGLLLISIIGYCLYSLGLDTTANAIALLALVIAIILIFLFGKDIKYATSILKLKKSLYHKIYSSTKNILTRIFKPDEPGVVVDTSN